MEPIRVQTKTVYGNDLMYVVSEHAAPIRALTGKKTIDSNDINQLKKLGFSFVAAPVLLGVKANASFSLFQGLPRGFKPFGNSLDSLLNP